MIYNNFKGKSISALGFGTMRLPTVGGDNAKIDQAKVNEMFDYAIAHGVNYFDTAFIYPGSEAAIGEIFEKNKRVKILQNQRILCSNKHFCISFLSISVVILIDSNQKNFLKYLKNF